MDTNKVNLNSHLKEKYEEEKVRLLRNWEFIIKRIVD